jgi:hemoglobin
MAEENPTLYERLGGEAGVDTAVDSFYEKVLADTSISPFFEGLDMQRQARKQKAFLTVAFGGPNRYSDRAMGAAHAKARENGLNDAHYDAVVGHLTETLGELGVSDADVQEVRAVTESVRDEILGR